MVSQFISQVLGRGRASSGSAPRRQRPARRIAAVGQAIEAMEGRVLLSTLYVDASAPGPANDGASWATAYNDLQLALGASVGGDEIRIADGTYKPTSTTDRTISFALRNGVSIYGGYAGYGAPDPDARDIALYPTILSGDIGTPASKTDNSYHVLTASAVGSSTVLDGMTVTGGNADGLYQAYGGGLFAGGNGSPTLTNCTFAGNSAKFGGGGMYCNGASPALTNCTFSGNSAADGGGLYNSNSASPTLTNCIIRANSATGERYTHGGGMYNSSSSPTLLNCTIVGNWAASSGMGYSYGGGIFNSYSSLTLTNCIIWGNWASAGGGMHNTSSSSPKLANCTVGGNSAFDSGGGIYNSSAVAPKLTNCILWGNIARSSPQVYTSGSQVPITCSAVQGGYAGTGNINAEPLFVRVPWTGPDAVYGTADDDLGDLHLRPGSPGLNVGSNAAVSGISTDFAGNARIQGGTVDMGAYEGTITPRAPRTFYVDHAATSGANTGVSWTDAFTSLQPALATAIDGDTVRVADGTYKPTSTTDRALGFALRNGVAIYGGYAGQGASDPDARDVALHPTVLSGNIGSAGRTDNSFHVLTATGVNASTALDGITIVGGNAYSLGLYQSYGGGLFALGGSPTLTNCTFSGNTAVAGGGMYCYSASPTLINCTFIGNTATGSSTGGGGMHNTYSASPTLINCIIWANSATDSSFSYGGGMYNTDSSSPTLINCTIGANSAKTGGGIYSSSSALLANCILWGNTAQFGSQIHRSSGTISVTCSDVEGGYAGVGNINADPLFTRTPSPGRDNGWGTGDDDYGDLRLQPASPCVDAGINTTPGLPGILTDRAGNPRFVDIALTPDTGTGTPPIIDMGAYEVQQWCPAWLDPSGLATWNASAQTLDIGENSLLVAANDSNRAERLEAVRQFIASARGGGAGIVSSAAGEDQAVIATLDEGASIVIRLALRGDVTLDDRLDGDDYFALDRAFLADGSPQPAADLNLDGVIDGRDYFVLDARFLGGLGGTVSPATVVPMEQVAQRPGGMFSTRSIAEELLIEEESVLVGV